MTPGRIFFVGLLLVAGLLFVLNPDEARFQEYVAEQIAEQGGRGGAMQSFIRDRLGEVGAALATEAFERENYHLASVYEADLNGRMPGGEWRYLGIAGWFFVLESPLDAETR